jgi:hypothetical protein
MIETTHHDAAGRAESESPGQASKLDGPSLRLALAGAGGGQGTTTVATVLAVLAAGHAITTLVATRPDDVCALTATGPSDAGGVVKLVQGATLAQDPLGWGSPPGDVPAVVADLGRVDDFAVEADLGGEWTRWLVVRGPGYTNLRVALEAGWAADGAILLVESGRAISPVDVADVLGVPVIARVPVEPAVARVLDAGLLLTRLHHLAPFRSLVRLIHRQLALTPAP